MFLASLTKTASSAFTVIGESQSYLLYISCVHVNWITHDQGLNTHPFRCSDDATGDLSSIRNQDLGKAKHLSKRSDSVTTIMEFVKRVLGFHKTPPVLVESCLYELNCIENEVIPPKGRRVRAFQRFIILAQQAFHADEELPVWKGALSSCAQS